MEEEMKQLWWLIVCSTLMLIIISAGCSEKGEETGVSQEAAGTEAQMVRFPVEVTPAVKTDWAMVISSTGSLLPYKEVAISAEISGTISQIFVNVGDRVSKGTLLAKFDDTEIALALKQAEANLSQAEANFRSAQLELQRKEELLKEEAIPQGVYDAFKTRYDLASAGVDAAKAALELARNRLQDTLIKSPIDGLIKLKMTEEGQYVNTMQSGPLFSVIQIHPIKLKFSVPEGYAAELKKGQTVRGRVDAYPGESFPGKVTTIDPHVDLLSRAMGLEAILPNPDHRLKPGFFATVELTLKVIAEAIVIPDKSLIKEEDRFYVFVISEQIAHRREVQLGFQQGRTVQIASGLKEGELVVIIGKEALSEGSQVQITSP